MRNLKNRNMRIIYGHDLLPSTVREMGGNDRFANGAILANTSQNKDGWPKDTDPHLFNLLHNKK